MPAVLAWTQLQFLRVAEYVHSNHLSLKINQNKIISFASFVKSILFSRIDLESVLQIIRKSVDANIASGIDVSVGFGGLLDHVMFVYGYDDENLYIFETTKTNIKYENIDKNHPQIMKLSIEEIRNRWTKFGRVWEISRVV